MVDRLQQLLAGIKVGLQSEQCALVGGHSSEGQELSVGLAITGVADRKTILPKGPLLAGQRLILTKGLGTGVIIAADMELKARGRWVAGAVSSALQSNRDAARILASVATTCTDITGFGLLGHLLEMLKYNAAKSDIGVELNLSAVPILDGALECVQAGVSSSLLPQVSHWDVA
jgi:selenide, water dikinase